MLYVGDKETNRYTDAVIADIKGRIKTDFEVSYYGGSTYIPHTTRSTKETLTMPSVCINTNANFTYACTQYLLKNTDGSINTYWHDFINTLPYAYGIKLYIYYNADTEDKAKIIEEQLLSQYADEVEIWVDILNTNGQKSLVKLRVDTTDKPKTVTGTFWKSKEIKFIQYFSVYFWQGYDVQNIEDNPKQQFALLQAAEFALLTHSKLTKDAIRLYEIDYNAVVTHKKLFNFLLPKAYREVKDRFDRGQHIDRTLFETAFANIVNVYPQLYDYFMQGMSYEQIESDMKNRAEILSQRYAQLCDDLQLPEILRGEYDVVLKCRNLDSLQIFLNKMVNTDKSLEETIVAHFKELEEKRALEIQEKQERARMQAEYGYNDTPSSNRGGFWKDTASTTIGVFGGELLTDRRRKREAKKEIQWRYTCSLSCPYKGKGYGSSRCTRDPRTCGHGSRY